MPSRSLPIELLQMLVHQRIRPGFELGASEAWLLPPEPLAIHHALGVQVGR